MYYVNVPKNQSELYDALIYAGKFFDGSSVQWEESEAQATLEGIRQSLVNMYGHNGEINRKFEDSLKIRAAGGHKDFLLALNDIAFEVVGFK